MDTEPFMIEIWARRGCQPVLVTTVKTSITELFIYHETQFHGNEYVEVDTEDKQDSAFPRFPELFWHEG